jgi:purine-binding chemotaxis protein CheW
MEKETYLTFLVGKEYFAVNVKNVLEVLEHQRITKVPQTPSHILGILNFRGSILPVVDTNCKFGLPQSDTDLRKLIIVYDLITDEKSFNIAATADKVKDVIEVSQEEIQTVPEMGIRYDNQYITGTVRREDDFILMLDINKILTAADSNSIQNSI